MAGGFGSDELKGGAGDDLFDLTEDMLDDPDFNVDEIVDFVRGSGRILTDGFDLFDVLDSNGDGFVDRKGDDVAVSRIDGASSLVIGTACSGASHVLIVVGQTQLDGDDFTDNVPGVLPGPDLSLVGLIGDLVTPPI
ncbi:calcium-binding protein [Geminicoccus flavidas]|uniref:hypothetical protein n=1 Tax=Geminicoccus flavidas TaxID=2506407 RepID=UPI00135B163F|nr:hypothetical protein [Geminicoccus flavidas]